MWKILSKLRTDYHMSFKDLTEYAVIEALTGLTDEQMEKILGRKKDA